LFTETGRPETQLHPLLVRQVIWPVHERLLRRSTARMLLELEASQWRTIAELRSLQERKLQLLLNEAQKTPLYCDRFRMAGVDPAVAGIRDLARLPLLTKDDIRKNPDDLIVPTRRHGLIRVTTGGSTGAPLTFQVDRSRQSADQAARARTRKWFGIDVGDRELYLWGSPIEASMQDRLKGIRDRLTNQRLFNAFDMNPPTMSRYLREMRRFDPVHLFGYPSSIARLVRHARETGRPFANPSLKAVFVTGEVFDPGDRATIEEAVDCAVSDGYGAREAGFIAHQCPQGSYHITMENLIVEIVDPSGQSVSPGEEGEIVITNLDALAMPFIRYRTGDLGRISPETCPCARGLECLTDIRGRKADRVRKVGGGEAHALSLIYVLRETPGVQEFKIIQQADLSLDVFVVVEGTKGIGDNGMVSPPQFQTATDKSALAERLAARIGPNVDVRIREVDAIPPAPSGKHRCVVSFA
jgi:phenylacetate-CoA ligase